MTIFHLRTSFRLRRSNKVSAMGHKGSAMSRKVSAISHKGSAMSHTDSAMSHKGSDMSHNGSATYVRMSYVQGFGYEPQWSGYEPQGLGYEPQGVIHSILKTCGYVRVL